ncbi:hypothetical protein Pst134EB_001255 [Puccinia striiformis f. sp. tritici]|nr:hypothetical protein Pst134EB_001255 [Puccinia striiformis f. sp. tritici]
MPMPPDYEPETPGTDGIKTITLDQAIGILEASSTTVPESGPVDFDGIIKEQRVNTSRKKTQDKNYKDHITSHKSIHGDAGSSTRPTSSPQHLSEVLLGDPLNTRCAICKGKFCLPEKDSGNDWVGLSQRTKTPAHFAAIKSFHQLYMSHEAWKISKR